MDFAHLTLSLLLLTALAALWAQIAERRYHEGQAKHWREMCEAEVERRRRERRDEVDAADWWKGDDYDG